LRDNSEASLENAVVGGMSFKATNLKGYIAFGSRGENRKTIGNETSVGKVWVEDDKGFENKSAELAFGSSSVSVSNYKVLSCVQESYCMIERVFSERNRGCCSSTL